MTKWTGFCCLSLWFLSFVTAWRLPVLPVSVNIFLCPCRGCATAAAMQKQRQQSWDGKEHQDTVYGGVDSESELSGVDSVHWVLWRV